MMCKWLKDEVCVNSDCPMCGGFDEMHATEDQEAEVWNRRCGNG